MFKPLKKVIYFVLILLLINFSIIYFQSCKQDFGTTPDIDSQFPSNIDSIFNTPYTSSNLTCNTSSCHSSGSTTLGGGLDLTNWQKTMNGSNNGTMVIPYNGFWSHMIAYLNSDTNVSPVAYIDPLSPFYAYHKIDAQKISTLMNWINDGAKSNEGQIAFSNISNNDKGFVTNQAADLVAVIRPNERQVIRLIPVGGITTLDKPHYVTLSPDNNYFFVSLIGAGYIKKFDVNNYAQVSGNMAAGQSPAHIVISLDGSTGYITNFSSSNIGSGVTRFNPNLMQVIDNITDVKMTAPHGMALSNDGNFLYVTSQIGEYIFKVNTNYFTNPDSTLKSPVDPTVPPGGGGTGSFKPYQCALSPDDSLLFVTCTAENHVRVYKTSDLSQVNSILVGKNPLILKFNNNGNYLFVCNRNDSSVTVINTATQTVQTTILNVGIQPHGVDFTADGQYAIIACETQSGFDGHHPQVGSTKPGTSRIIQISNFTLLPDRLEMGSFPAGIVIVK